MRRTLRWSAGALAVQSIALLVVALLLPGIAFAGAWTAVLGCVLVTLGTLCAWPLVYRLAARLSTVLIPIVGLAWFAGVVYLSSLLVHAVVEDGFQVSWVLSGAILALVLTVSGCILGIAFGMKDSEAYERFVVRRLQRRYRDAPHSDEPGIVFLTVDGLAEPLLQQAISEGYAPTLDAWMKRGSHTLYRWEPDLSSQTAACQAGILMGSNEGIPAFRWWDKERGRLMVAKDRETALALEEQLSDGDGLLAGGGVCRFTIFSGNADDCVGTLSQVAHHGAGGQLAYLLYFVNPYTVLRTISLFGREVLRERWEARRQEALNVQPRIKRPPSYAPMRAGATVIVQEAARFMVTADMIRGLPVIYATFYAYDEVAHHSGIDRPDAFKVLQRVDAIIGALEDVSHTAPRPYRFVILSDHGQSMGATFKQRYGMTLGAVVDDLVEPDLHVAEPINIDEGVDEINMALADALSQQDGVANWIARVLGRWVPGVGAPEPPGGSAEEIDDILVLASGNLGLISFTRYQERLTMEQIDALFPRLIPGLTQHPGIGFVSVRTDDGGMQVIGPSGRRRLDRDIVSGDDPLQHYGDNAARHLLRAGGFTNAPDILVMSLVEPESGSVAAFEELVGCHGGLGGPQTEPFLLAPAELDVQQSQIIGAAALHTELKRWASATLGSNARVQPGANH